MFEIGGFYQTSQSCIFLVEKIWSGSEFSQRSHPAKISETARHGIGQKVRRTPLKIQEVTCRLACWGL